MDRIPVITCHINFIIYGFCIMVIIISVVLIPVHLSPQLKAANQTSGIEFQPPLFIIGLALWLPQNINKLQKYMPEPLTPALQLLKLNRLIY